MKEWKGVGHPGKMARFQPEKQKRPRTKLKVEDIDWIAVMWFVLKLSSEEIADHYKVNDKDIRHITMGMNFVNPWGAAVTKLVVAGYDVSRPPAKKGHRTGKPIGDEMALAIRREFLEDQYSTAQSLADSRSITKYIVTGILSGKTYNRPELYPRGWQLNADERRSEDGEREGGVPQECGWPDRGGEEEPGGISRILGGGE